MTDSRIRFGLIGCGGIAKWHILPILSLKGASLTTVCDEQPERVTVSLLTHTPTEVK